MLFVFSDYVVWEQKIEKGEVRQFLILELFFVLPLASPCSLLMGMLCYFTNWTVKLGKMFVSSKMMEICSNLAWLLLWSGYVLFINQKSPFVLVGLLFPKLLLNVAIGYLSCILVSRVQSSKTVHKILLACNLKLN